MLFLSNSSRYQLQESNFNNNGIKYGADQDLPVYSRVKLNSNLEFWASLLTPYLPLRKDATLPQPKSAYGGTFFSSNSGIVNGSPGYVQSILNCTFSSVIGIQLVADPNSMTFPTARLVGGLIAVQGNDISSKIEVCF